MLERGADGGCGSKSGPHARVTGRTPQVQEPRGAASKLEGLDSPKNKQVKSNLNDATSKSEALKSLGRALALALLVGLVIWCFCFNAGSLP